MNSAYKEALAILFFFEAACFVKKETVSGTIGKTQGVTKAIKPPPIPNRNNASKLFPCASSSPHCDTGCSISIVSFLGFHVVLASPPSSATEKEKGVDGYNSPSLPYVNN